MKKRFLSALALIWLLGTAASGQEEPLQVLFNQRPPYMRLDENGALVGLTASVVLYALEKAGVAYRLMELPSQRQMVQVQQNAGRIAAIGWFKNADREKFARFSRPLYQDKQIVVLARKDSAHPASKKTVGELLGDRKLSMLAKLGYSYGQFIDRKIAEYAPVKVEVSVENVSMIRMLYERRADYLFIAPEEASVVLAEAGYKPTEFQMITLSDMPLGEKRYLMYSPLVDERTIGLIDRYIDEYVSRSN